jgi:hypothetical protein
MLYEIATLSCPVLSLRELSTKAGAWFADSGAEGTVLGCWRAEAGTLGRLLVLRGFDAPEALVRERNRTLMSASPFNGGQTLTGYSSEGYAAFPSLPPVQPQALGALYEFRTYHVVPGTLARVMAGWQAAMEPAQDYTRHMVVNMYALDGPPRITHIWGFPSFEDRLAIRTRAAAAGVWPPSDVPEHIVNASSVLAIPEAGSPLH